MTVCVNTSRHTFWKDHFRYFVRAADTTAVDPLWDTDGATGDFVFPPTDGVIRWRLPFCLEVIPGKEAGEIDVDVAWLDGPPAGVDKTDGVASACDIATPTGRVAITDSYDEVVASHDFGNARTCRVFVEVVDRDVSGEGEFVWEAKTSEHHTILICQRTLQPNGGLPLIVTAQLHDRSPATETVTSIPRSGSAGHRRQGVDLAGGVQVRGQLE